MAKTKGSNPPVTEEIYTDAGGIIYYFGEFFRGLFREGFISPSDPGSDITGQSTRGMRPAQQGDGSAAQEVIRGRYKSCIALWHALPNLCPVPPIGPPSTSKESVWSAKTLHGVVCSYYDLFMRCCLKWARDHGGSMPDGDCFPCETPCICANATIEYTTGAMQVNEQQDLSVSDYFDFCVYDWEIISGGGSLSSGSGSTVTYTAPASNPSCIFNVSIRLSINGNQCDIVYIAINAHVPPVDAYKVLTCVQDRTCVDIAGRPHCFSYVDWYYFTCDGVFNGSQDFYHWFTYPASYEYSCPWICDTFPDWLTCSDAVASVGGYSLGEVVDLRSPALIASGCCPEALL